MMNSKKVMALLLLFVFGVASGLKSFNIDYNAGTFMKDGEPFNFVSGSIHYSRVHPDLWYDRLYKMRYAGLDAIQVYIPWNFHEMEQGEFKFEGSRDVEKFLKMAQSLDLLVILRIGPYICGEWEFGGFPYWLIATNESIALRTSDPSYLKFVKDWYNVLLPKMRPLLYVNGGPIISVQIENEYGSYFACDSDYMNYLFNLTKQLLADDVVYFTTDGDGLGYLKCGALEGTLTTVDFGAGSAKRGFEVLNHWNFSFYGPYVNSEYYIGWLDIWGQKHAHVDAHSAAKTLDEALAMKANINMYMFYGGTNFGFSSGAPGDNPFNPVPTSYDYDAAISEAGDLTYKYYLLRYTIGKHKKLPMMEQPKNSTKTAYGRLNVTLQGPMLFCAELLDHLGYNPAPRTVYPLRMEVMGTGYGYIIYRHQLQKDFDRVGLSVPGIRDRGYTFVNDVFYGVLYRDGPTNITISGKAGDTLAIVVENMGRVGYGSGIMRGTKGIISNVTIGDMENVTTWYNFNLKYDIQNLQLCYKYRMKSNLGKVVSFSPSTFMGVLNVKEPADTFIRLDSWFKGHVAVNDFNIGRYWTSKGPQKTLYIPAPLLKAGDNIITVTELEANTCFDAENCYVELVDTPEINSDVAGVASPMKFYGRRDLFDL